jgi:hypothetical protein
LETKYYQQTLGNLRNGVGKFNDFTPKALQEIRFGCNLYFTGVPHHALIQDYTAIGISNDDPEIVKGRAGSPYAVKITTM